MAADKSFLGSGWSFPPQFSLHNKSISMVKEDQDIQQSLRILFSTLPGERLMQPAYGCSLKTLVFDAISESTVTEIKDAIDRAVLFFETRITLNDIAVNTDDVYDGVVRVTLDYTIRSTNNRSNMVYPFYFREGTNLLYYLNP